MANPGRLARRVASNLFRKNESLTPPTNRVRTFTARPRPTTWSSQQIQHRNKAGRPYAPTYQVRHAANESAVAPNSKAYLDSGVIAGAQNLVDVKKVLVIGSGGLSIGQAGEFDYSGESHPQYDYDRSLSGTC